MADLPHDGEQLRADLQVHADVLQLLVGQHLRLDVQKTAVFDEGDQLLESEVDVLQLLRFHLLLELLGRVSEQLLEVVQDLVGGEDEQDFVFGLIVELHDAEAVLTVG